MNSIGWACSRWLGWLEFFLQAQELERQLDSLGVPFLVTPDLCISLLCAEQLSIEHSRRVRTVLDSKTARVLGTHQPLLFYDLECGLVFVNDLCVYRLVLHQVHLLFAVVATQKSHLLFLRSHISLEHQRIRW